MIQSVTLATVDQLFAYKKRGLELDGFPGYSDDQWGIKAHNRPYVDAVGNFRRGQTIVEVGGAYSSFPKYLAKKYGLEAWIADDFGLKTKDAIWSRWGDPQSLVEANPEVKYIFENFGEFSPSFPREYFDRIFTISTLEHVSPDRLHAVLSNMHVCLKPSGMEVHTIDVPVRGPRESFLFSLGDRFQLLRKISKRFYSDIRWWVDQFRKSGASLQCPVPNTFGLLDRSTLVESPDVVYRFYPPNNQPKPYRPAGSLLIILKKVVPEYMQPGSSQRSPVQI